MRSFLLCRGTLASSAGRAPWVPEHGLPGSSLLPNSVLSDAPAEAPCPVLVAAAVRSS